MAKVFVVTGAGSGIGKAVAHRLAEAGRVVVADVNEAAAQKTASLLQSSGFNAQAVTVDVTDEQQVCQLAKGVSQTWGAVDGVVHCAGISQRRLLDEITEADWDRMIGVNLKGSFLVAKSFAPVMNNDGALVVVSSGSAFTGSGGGVHYASSKAGQLGLVRALARELAPRGIRVNAICPRSIQTPMLDALYRPEDISALVDDIPLRRLGTDDDVATLARYLVIEDRFMTGQWMLVDGGRTYSK